MLIKANETRVLGRKSSRTGRVLLGVLLGVLALVATVCAGASTAVAGSPAPAAPVGGGGGGGGPRLVIVRMVDFRFLQPNHFSPGQYTFRAVNEGRMPHILAIQDSRNTNVRTPLVQPGGSADITVTLGPGVYDFWCPVDNHRQRGMQLDVFVK